MLLCGEMKGCLIKKNMSEDELTVCGQMETIVPVMFRKVTKKHISSGFEIKLRTTKMS